MKKYLVSISIACTALSLTLVSILTYAECEVGKDGSVDLAFCDDE